MRECGYGFSNYFKSTCAIVPACERCQTLCLLYCVCPFLFRCVPFLLSRLAQLLFLERGITGGGVGWGGGPYKYSCLLCTV